MVIADIVGSKGAAGAWQQVISMLPSHRVFVEAFAGGAAVTRKKRPAELTILIERDPETAASLRDRQLPSATVVNADAAAVLPVSMLPASVCVYCDPPYVMASRKCQRRYYRFDWSDEDHERFLAWITGATCPVVISGYHSDLYETRLRDWRCKSFGVPTRRGRAVEWLWCNFPETAELHDSRFVGNSFTDRQRIRRKAQRWVRMLAAMPAEERSHVLAAIYEGLRIPQPSVTMCDRQLLASIGAGAIDLRGRL